MTWTRDRISEATAFDFGDVFRSEEDVRQYFTVEKISSVLGECPYTQDELNEMAETVISHGWHMARRPLWCPYCGARFESDTDELARMIGPGASDPSEWSPQAVTAFLAEHFGHTCGE